MNNIVRVTLDYEIERSKNIDEAVNEVERELKKDSNYIYTANSITIESIVKSLYEELNKNYDDLEQFVEEYRKLFPPGKKDNIYPFRGIKEKCIENMKWFLKNNHVYTKEKILEATREYVYQHRLRGYVHIQQAHYFLKKDGGSALGAFLENYKGKEDKNERVKEI